jgi:hypothetical protein
MPIDRNYDSLEEALRDIEFSHEDEFIGHYFEISSTNYTTEHLYCYFTRFMEWLSSKAQQKDVDAGIITEINYMIWELMKNAHRSAMTKYPEGRFRTKVFLGSKGVLVGTEQETEFLTREQIDLLMQGKNVPSTKPENSIAGMGTRILVNYGKGVFISEEEKAVYFSRFFS